MNGSLFKIVLISVIAILLAIIGGIMSADEKPVSLALAIAPFALAGLYLMKEKVWYLWILLPFLFIPFPTLYAYSWLLAYTFTLPFYLWNVMIRRSSLTWNAAPPLDMIVFLMFLHVGWVFLSHPFGIGLNIMEDYYGGKGYIMFLQAFLAYICLSSLKTSSNELGKILQWAVGLTVFFTLVSTVRFILFPNTAAVADMAAAAGAGSGEGQLRNMTFLDISSLVLRLLVINYSIWQMIKRPWWILLAALACAGIMVSGFRSAIASILILFITISILYKRWFFSIIAPITGLLLLVFLSSAGILKELPFGVQRTLSAVPFLDVSPQARRDAEESVRWRVEMWQWALDDREHFIQDKIFGDGFSRNINILKANIYEKAYNLSKDQTDFAWNGLWHSGPVSTIQTLGYVGLTLYTIMSVIGMIYAWIVCRIYRNHKYKLGILYVSALYFVDPIGFFLIFGDSAAIPQGIISLGIIKVLFSCAKKEGLYISLHVRKEYVPFMIRQEKKQSPMPASPSISG